jgi:hypothetical protein
LSTESWMCEETDGLTDMVKPTYVIQLCNGWTDRYGETNICHTTMLWVKKQMGWQTWWNQHMPYNYVASGIKRNWPFFCKSRGINHEQNTFLSPKSNLECLLWFLTLCINERNLSYWMEIKCGKSLQTQIKLNAPRQRHKNGDECKWKCYLTL